MIWWTKSALMAFGALIPFQALAKTSKAAEAPVLATFDATLKLINDNFYDKNFRGLPWADLSREARASLNADSTEADLKAALSGLLARLKTSHTAFYSDADQDFWGLSSIFSHRVDGAPFAQIGAWFYRSDDGIFVKNCFSGSPCEKAGLVPGDQILSVDGEPLVPGRSFRDKSEVALVVKKSRDAKPLTIKVRPRLESAQRSQLRATKKSERRIEVDGKQIGYFHLWSGSNVEFQKALRSALPRFQAKSDCLVLDLRDGFGGAGEDYVVDFFDHDFHGKKHVPTFTKPLVVLINGGVRSGKEWITDLLKSSGRAHLVGERTAGYFIAGRYFPIVPKRYLLYLAVQRFTPEGVPDLEGVGVEPHEEVPHSIPFSAGADPQLEAALKACRARVANP